MIAGPGVYVAYVPSRRTAVARGDGLRSDLRFVIRAWGHDGDDCHNKIERGIGIEAERGVVESV